MTIGEKIHDLRLRNNMTMEDLARQIGVQRSAINKYEKGLVVNLKRSTIASLCRVFGVPSSYLLDDNNELTADEHRLVQAYRAADDRAQEDALKTPLDHPKKELLTKVK